MRSAASSKPVSCLPPLVLITRFSQKNAEELCCLSHRVLHDHPASLTASFVAACFLHLQGAYSQAIDLYKYVVLQNPDHFLAWGLLGQL